MSIRNNPVVREIDQQQRADFYRTVGVVGVIVLMLLFSTWQHLRVVNGGYKVSQLKTQRDAIAEANRLLRLEFERQSAPRVIEERAKRELHMAAPGAPDVLFIDRVRATKPGKAVVADAR